MAIQINTMVPTTAPAMMGVELVDFGAGFFCERLLGALDGMEVEVDAGVDVLSELCTVVVKRIVVGEGVCEDTFEDGSEGISEEGSDGVSDVFSECVCEAGGEDSAVRDSVVDVVGEAEVADLEGLVEGLEELDAPTAAVLVSGHPNT